MTTFNINYIE